VGQLVVEQLTWEQDNCKQEGQGLQVFANKYGIGTTLSEASDTAPGHPVDQLTWEWDNCLHMGQGQF
jgi:hypothetical protein